MNVRKVLAVFAIVAVICLSFGMFLDTAHAQADSNATTNYDKDMATKRGVSGALADGTESKPTDGPTKLQMGLGVGSVIVAFIVVKWL